MIQRILSLILLISATYTVKAQSVTDLQALFDPYFKNYTTSLVNVGSCKLNKVDISHNNKEVYLYVNSNFGYQPFREENTIAIYRHLKKLLPQSINNYDILVFVDGHKIEDLIPNYYRTHGIDKDRIHEPIDNRTAPWVKNISKPYQTSKGLENRHLSVWQSHGMYFKNNKSEWTWQRPHLYGTTEDQFTQSFVIPFLIPMLENAGANVFTPRERDIQKHEVIVDNDMQGNSYYIEQGKRRQRWERYEGPGFAPTKNYYFNGENPFYRGTSRIVPTKRNNAKAFAQWVPTLPVSGKYAVYVTYQTTANSVSDANYIVFHQGGVTEFKVNQKIGGGTWVYLGTFDFIKGNNATGMVVLTNKSSYEGVVSADAVRFGGGMGNIIRGGSTSGMPRYLEGARYSAQWYGMPSEVYNGKQGENDYIDDINTRSNAINYLSGGSVFNPKQYGLAVPLELNIALHSDAGYHKNDKVFGSLGIYTTESKSGKLGSGKHRISSRDLTDIIMTELQNDIQANFDIQWTRRGMWNRNYSETRLPEIPSMILELLSHENFADMTLGHDPYFKFIVSRSIYKSILKYLSHQSKKDYVVQPLPIQNFAVELEGNKANLSWTPILDPTEPSAMPREFIVYTRMGNSGFDNGIIVKGTSHSIKLEPGIIYSFRVAAVNKGGESFPSEILVAYKAPKEMSRVLIVNGFQRISGPQTINTDFEAGFDLYADPGVPYIYDISLAGNQKIFRRTQMGKSGEKAMGYSSNELEGYTLAGNTFDYPYIHGKAIQKTPGVSFSSTSRGAVELGYTKLSNYPIVDLILGLQKEDDHNPHKNQNYKTFSPKLKQRLTDYSTSGGNIFISGSYIGSDMSKNPEDLSFIQNLLKCDYIYSIQDKDVSTITGLGREVTIPRHLNETFYSVSRPEVLQALDQGFPVMTYKNINHTAAVAYKGKYKSFTLGFPFESIQSMEDRATIMASILYFFLK